MSRESAPRSTNFEFAWTCIAVERISIICPDDEPCQKADELMYLVLVSAELLSNDFADVLEDFTCVL